MSRDPRFDVNERGWQICDRMASTSEGELLPRGRLPNVPVFSALIRPVNSHKHVYLI